MATTRFCSILSIIILFSGCVRFVEFHESDGGDADADADADADVDADGSGDADGDSDRDADNDSVSDAHVDSGDIDDADIDGGDRCGFCGDGLVRCDEQCDYGAPEIVDGCDSDCRFETVGSGCGNAAEDDGEVCDDGNLINGDNCNPTCNFVNQTELFVGTPTVQGNHDDIGSAATLGGWGALAVIDDWLWYGDAHNQTLRRIEISSARITTIAGGRVSGTVDAPDGADAGFGAIEALATDGETVWVADHLYLREVDAAAPYGVTTVMGGTSGCSDGFGLEAQVEDIRGVTYFGGFIWFADSVCATVRRFDPRTGEVITVAGSARSTGYVDGYGTAARFVSPRYIATNMTGILYIADTNGAAIRTFDTSTGEVQTFAGDGTVGYVDDIGTSARIHRPRGMTVDGTSIYFTEFNQHTIRQGVLVTHEISTMIGSQGIAGYTEGVGLSAQLNGPFSIVYHFPSRSLFFIDSSSFVIRRIQ